MVRDVLGKEPVVLEFDGRHPEESQLSLRSMLTDCRMALHEAFEFIYKHASFEVLIIGAEIDEDSESLWVWLDNPENPVQDRD